MTIQIKDGDELKTVVEINEKSKPGRFIIFCTNVGFVTLAIGTVKTAIKLINKFMKKGA